MVRHLKKYYGLCLKCGAYSNLKKTVRTQLQGMGLESHIGSMGFRWGVYKALGSPNTIASFCDVVLPRFLSKTFNALNACLISELLVLQIVLLIAQ